MLFHSSIRKELARSFGATLVVVITVVMTMTLLRTLGEASRGTFAAADVMLIMGYTVLSDLPTILSMSLFIATLSVLTRMYRDSEMVIWFGSGHGLATLLRPMFRFAWPILVVILALAFLILPWAFGRIEDLRYRYEKRGDIARIEPGQFQESATGDRVFFIDKDARTEGTGKNVFIATQEASKQTITTAQAGQVEIRGDDKFLMLDKGQRLERGLDNASITVSLFERYGARIGADDHSSRDYAPTQSLTSAELLRSQSPSNLAELAWRIGLTLAALNFVVIALASAGVNPRAGRASNLGFAFLTFIVYFNLLVLGKSWIQSGEMGFLQFLISLHGGTLSLALLWLSKRHYNWTLQRVVRGLYARREAKP